MKPLRYVVLAVFLAACNGPSGPSGQEGLVGPQGPKGDVGPVGQVGPQGVPGDVGPVGPQGPQGNVGPQGPQGVVGPVGPQGPQGLVGLTGPVGPQGPQGIAGPKGDVGATGPKGDTGATGATGAVGPKGDTGAVGPQGPMGAMGLQGPAGIDGLPGPKGDTGSQGPKGDTGPQGPQGAVGATGPQGGTGATGAQGPAGPAMYWVDANGTVVTPFISYGTGFGSAFLYLSSDGTLWLLNLASGTVTPWYTSPFQVMYTQPNCQGTAYISTGGMMMPRMAINGGNGAYYIYPDNPNPSLVTGVPVVSYMNSGGPCTSGGGTGYTLFPVQSLIPVPFPAPFANNNFQTPFHLEVR